jgi:putative glutamine amidotransferase
LPRKTALIEEGSRLHEILGCAQCKVNSLHHQAVDRLGGSLRSVARDLDGLVQGFEHAGEAFVLGVQWHPEYLVYIMRHRAIFASLVSAAR